MEVRVFSWAMLLCSCCSGKPYAECCKPFHEGVLPETAQQLMRSRYSAYALDLPDYIIKTTHSANPQYSKDTESWKRSISHFSKHSTFDRLVIHDFQENGKTATVTFTAYITQGGHEATFTEKSTFEKEGKMWLYRSGEILKSL